jgi:hypothetical protein
MCDDHISTEMIDINIIDNDKIKYYKTYKSYNGHLFARQFPDHWILDQESGTGTECDDCLKHASWRGVLLGYCTTCAVEYKVMGDYTRGPGFWDCGVEVSWIDWDNCAFYGYLKGISMDNIGDIDFNPAHTFEKYQETWDYVHCSNYISEKP